MKRKPSARIYVIKGLYFTECEEYNGGKSIYSLIGTTVIGGTKSLTKEFPHMVRTFQIRIDKYESLMKTLRSVAILKI